MGTNVIYSINSYANHNGMPILDGLWNPYNDLMSFDNLEHFFISNVVVSSSQNASRMFKVTLNFFKTMNSNQILPRSI